MTEPERLAHRRRLLPRPIGTVTAPGKSIVVGDYYLGGWSLLETTGAAAAVVNLWDGGNNTGVLLAQIAIPQGTSVASFLGGHALVLQNGLFVEVVSGSVSGVIYAASK